jgi:hypothetical protein
MQVKDTPLNPLGSIQLSPPENSMLKWIRTASWDAVQGAHGATNYRAKIPEFFGGVRLYTLQGGGAHASAQGALELFIRKLGLQGVIAKQALYPIEGHGSAPRYLCLKKADLDNLGVGQKEEEE